MRLARVALVVSFVVLASCATTTVFSTWMAPDTNPHSAFVVLGLIDNLTIRTRVENAVAAELKKAGVSASSSLTFMTPDQKLEMVNLEREFAARGYDAIMIIRPVSSEDIENQVTETVYYEVYDSYHNRKVLVGKDETRAEKVGTRLSVETDVYDNGHDKLIWRAISETDDYDDHVTSARSFASKTVKAMIKDGIISPGE